MSHRTRGFSLLVLVIILAAIGTVGYFIVTKKETASVEPSSFVTFGDVESLAQLPDFYMITGTTNAEVLWMIIDHEGSTSPDDTDAHVWSGNLGHSLARDEHGVWSWRAPVYENGTRKLESGRYTIKVYEGEEFTENSTLLGSHSFDIP